MSEIALRYLYEAANAGSMRAAGDRIGVAVSSISRQIGQLELEYGLPLIERGRRSIQLTQAGRLAVDHYRSIVADRDALLMRIKDLRGVRSGNVTLGVGEGFLGVAFGELIQGFYQKHRQIRLTIKVMSSAAIVQDVLDDEAHFGMVLQVPPEPKIRVRASLAQPLMAIMSPLHPLAGRPSVSLQELAENELCLAPREFRIRQILNSAETRNRIFLEAAITTDSIHVMRDMARSQAAISVLPEISVWTDLEDGSLVAVPLADEEIEKTTLALISRVGRQLEGAPLRLLTTIEASLRTWGRPAGRS
jgi:DNA-binding transcriptional LysR family regulator